MHKLRRKKLISISAWLFFIAFCLFLLLYALKQNISLFYTPSQLKTAKLAPQQMFRLGGMVERGSVKRKPHSLNIEFSITDNKNKILVSYSGVLPDLFREGQGIVAHGVLKKPDYFVADEVLAKHDEKYMPPM